MFFTWEFLSGMRSSKRDFYFIYSREGTHVPRCVCIRVTFLPLLCGFRKSNLGYWTWRRHLYPLSHFAGWVFVCQLGTSWEEGTSMEKMFPSVALDASLWGIFLINNWCGRAQPTVGVSAPQHLVLSWISHEEQASEPMLRFLLPSSFPDFP